MPAGTVDAQGVQDCDYLVRDDQQYHHCGDLLMADGAGQRSQLFLQLLRTTGSEASSARLEEFMKRNNNDGGALSNSYKDFRQALDMAAKLEIPMPLASMANQIQEMGRATGLQRF